MPWMGTGGQGRGNDLDNSSMAAAVMSLIRTQATAFGANFS